MENRSFDGGFASSGDRKDRPMNSTLLHAHRSAMEIERRPWTCYLFTKRSPHTGQKGLQTVARYVE